MINEHGFVIKKDGTAGCNCLCTRPELIENYDKAIADKEQTWECHHRMEKYFPRETLIAIGWYYDCEPEELIFLTPSEHGKQYHKGKRLTEEQKRHLSEINKGKPAWNKGKPFLSLEKNPMYGKHHSEESKKKISESRKKYWDLKKQNN